MLSDLSSGMIGETLPADPGYHVMGL